jgi:hypothetical protein
MQCVARNDVRKLTTDPLSFAIMMDNMELEQVIAAFVAVLNKRKPYRGG